MAALLGDNKHEECKSLSPEAVEIWKQVAEGLTKEQLPIQTIHQALSFANEFLGSHDEAREFVMEHGVVIAAFLAKRSKEDTVELLQSLKLLAVNTAKLMNIQLQVGSLTKPNLIFGILFVLFATDYDASGVFKNRVKVLDAFHTQGGFSHLEQYFKKYGFALDSKNQLFFLCKLVGAAHNLHPIGHPHLLELFSSNLQDRIEVSVSVAENALSYIRGMPVDFVDDQSAYDELYHLLVFIEKILLDTTAAKMSAFFVDFRALVLKLLTSQNDAVVTQGWALLTSLVNRTYLNRPSAQEVVISGASLPSVNGTYALIDQTAFVGSNVYEKKDYLDGKERVMVIRKDASYGNGERWCLESRGDDDTSRSVHYVSESKLCGHRTPPIDGWKSVTNNDGCSGLSILFIRHVTFPGENGLPDCLEYDLAKWLNENKIVELFYSDTKNASSVSTMNAAVNFMAALSRVRSDILKNACSDSKLSVSKLRDLANRYGVRFEQVRLAWTFALRCEGVEAIQNACSSMAGIALLLDNGFVERLISTMIELFDGSNAVAEEFFLYSLLIETLKQSVEGGIYLKGTERAFIVDAPSLAARPPSVRLEIKRLMWTIARTRRGKNLVAPDSSVDIIELDREWSKWESFRPDGAKPLDKKPALLLLDANALLVQVSTPTESENGVYFFQVQIFASCDGKAFLLVTVESDAIGQALKAGSDRLLVETILPSYGEWMIWTEGFVFLSQGIECNDVLVESQRSEMSVIEVVAEETDLHVSRHVDLDSLDEIARKNAGDIRGAIGKNRGPAQMSIEGKFSSLSAAVFRGRSTLNQLERLIEDIGLEKDSVAGFHSLAGALAEADLPLKELDAILKQRNKKERAKGFKVHVSSLLESNSVASWIESVDASALECLGGDANRLYQLLVEDKDSSALDLETLMAASARDDLFSKKQIKTLSNLLQNAENVAKESVVASSPDRDTIVESATDQNLTSSSPSDEGILSVRKEGQENIKDPVAVVTPPKIRRTLPMPSYDLPLLAFLKEHHECLVGSPADVCQWLVDQEDITSIEDLANAVSDEHYVSSVLEKGNGSVAIDEFLRDVFKASVLDALSVAKAQVGPFEYGFDEDKENAPPGFGTSSFFAVGNKRDASTAFSGKQHRAVLSDKDKENIPPPCFGSDTKRDASAAKQHHQVMVPPPSMLLCRLSHVLMKDQPVTAADGYTYELSAIANYFERQNKKICAAKHKIEAGVSSEDLQAIVVRGILSPVTQEPLENLSLTPNEAVRHLARLGHYGTGDDTVPFACI